MNIYKSILLNLLEPLSTLDPKELIEYSDLLKSNAMQNPGVEMGTSIMLARAARFIQMSLDIVKNPKL